MALIACVVTLTCSVVAIASNMVRYMENGHDVRALFRYFTTISNIIIALASSFIIPFAINGIRKKRFTIPKWLSMVHFSGTVCTTIVIIFALVIILPYDRAFAIENQNFFLHIVSPIAILVSYFMVESKYVYTLKEKLICLIPFFIYSIVYLIMVVLIGKENGGWKDLYMLNTFAPFYITTPIAYLFAFLVTLILKKASDILNNRRDEKLFESWNKDANPVEVKIEVYGLGRFYGLSCDNNDLSVPQDTIESLATRYSIPEDELFNAFVKGLRHGIKEKEARKKGA